MFIIICIPATMRSLLWVFDRSFRLAIGHHFFIGHKSALNEMFRSQIISKVRLQNLNDHYVVVMYRFMIV